jgi:hypothetical protein
VIVENPQRQRYVVELLDKEGWRLYQNIPTIPATAAGWMYPNWQLIPVGWWSSSRVRALSMS